MVRFRGEANMNRHARPAASVADDPQRTFWLEATPQPDKQTILISVRDEGAGLPSDFDPAASKRLGTRLVNALSQQLKGELTRRTVSSGVSFTLVVPLWLSGRLVVHRRHSHAEKFFVQVQALQYLEHWTPPGVVYFTNKNIGGRHGIRPWIAALVDRHPVANHHSVGDFHAPLNSAQRGFPPAVCGLPLSFSQLTTRSGLIGRRSE